MKIILLTNGLGTGGAEKQLAILANKLSEKGYDVSIFSLIKPGNGIRYLNENQKEKLISFDLSKSKTSYIYALLAIIKIMKESPDVLITFMVQSNVLGLIIERISNSINVITSVRTQYVETKWLNLMKVLSKNKSAFVVNSVDSKQMLDKENVRGKKEIIPNFIGEFKPGDLNTENNTSKNSFRWIALGTVRKPKAYDVLANAMSGASGKRIIDIYGDIFDEEWGPNQALNVASIRFKGYASNIHNLLSKADAFVLCSRWEGQPNALMEAALHALPIVTTNVGGVNSFLKNTISAIIIPPEDELALKKAILKVETMSVKERSQMGRKAKEAVLGYFDDEKTLNKWERACFYN